MKITILGTAKFEVGTARFIESRGIVSILIEFGFDKYWYDTGLSMDEWSEVPRSRAAGHLIF